MKRNGQIKVALVTGASSGIGQALAEKLAKQGVTVYAAARRLENTRHPDGGNLHTLRLDVNDQLSCEQAAQQIIAEEGRLDLLVQSAGFGIAGAVEDTSIDQARGQMETNFFGSIRLLPAVLEQMRNQKFGLIVNIGSVAGQIPIPFQAYYSASKAAVSALTLALANEIKPFGIRCMVVQPGDTRTGFTTSREVTDRSLKSVYADRCGRSIERMARDEQNGMTTEVAARVIASRIFRRRPPLLLNLGLVYKAFSLAVRLLPLRLVRFVVGLMYAA